MCMIQVIIIVMASQWSNHWIMGTLVQPEVWTVGLQRIKDRRGQTWNKTFQETSLVNFVNLLRKTLFFYTPKVIIDLGIIFDFFTSVTNTLRKIAQEMNFQQGC